MKKIIAVLLVLILTVSCFAGCTSKEEAAPAEKTEASETAETKEAEAEPAEMYEAPEKPDYTGEYEDGNYDTVSIKAAAEPADFAELDMVIGIYRLCEIEAKAYYVDGFLYFSGKAPDESEIGGCFYSEEDGKTFTLLFNNSTWEYIKNGDSFEGFVLK